MPDEIGAVHPLHCITEQIVEQAEATPAAVALYAGREIVSYAELNARANRLARYLRALGVGSDGAVGIYLDRSAAMVVAALAVMKAGAAYLPLDPAQPAARLGFMLKDAGASVVLSSARLAEKLPAGSWRTIVLDAGAEEKTIAAQPANEPDGPVTLEDLAYIIYTSGSTGEPKGVEIPHRALANLVAWHLRAFAITSRDRASSLAALGFDAAVWEIWPYLCAGASVSLADDRVRSDAKALSDWMVARQLTIAFAPTAMAENLLQMAWPENTALRFLLTGADTLKKYPSAKLPFKLVNNYGPTENAVVATSGAVAAASDASQAPSIGRAIDGVEIYLLDENRQPVSEGGIGEIYIGGASLARGYRNLPELTGKVFVANPFRHDAVSEDTGARLYKTGDLARRLASGEIAFLGRVDEQVKIRGYRVEPAEVATVLGQYEGIRHAVVVASDNNSDDGGGGRELVAYVIGAPERNLSAAELRDFLTQRLPEYMVPAAFVAIDHLPLTANGKLDRAALPHPDEHRLRDEPFVAPRTPVEEELIKILGPLLKLDRIGVNDNFFLLGGHSLLGTQLIARVSESFGVDLTLLKLFDHPTVAGMSSEIENLILARVEAESRPDRSSPEPALTGAGRRSVL